MPGPSLFHQHPIPVTQQEIDHHKSKPSHADYDVISSAVACAILARLHSVRQQAGRVDDVMTLRSLPPPQPHAHSQHNTVKQQDKTHTTQWPVKVQEWTLARGTDVVLTSYLAPASDAISHCSIVTCSALAQHVPSSKLMCSLQ